MWSRQDQNAAWAMGEERRKHTSHWEAKEEKKEERRKQEEEEGVAEREKWSVSVRNDTYMGNPIKQPDVTEQRRNSQLKGHMGLSFFWGLRTASRRPRTRRSMAKQTTERESGTLKHNKPTRPC